MYTHSKHSQSDRIRIKLLHVSIANAHQADNNYSRLANTLAVLKMLLTNQSPLYLPTVTTTSRQLKEIQNKTNSENRHLVFLVFKKEQENDGVGDISSLFQRHCRTNVKDEISPTPSFSCSFLNIRNTRCLFSYLLYYL